MMERKVPLNGKKCVYKPRQSRKRPGCIRLFVCPTTGGRLEISVSPRESILGLKTALARKLKTNPARIALIHKEKALTSGRLIDYSIPEDSILTLLPNMESGLSLHQSEKSITQALENLSETQVNDFLSGRAPLMLAIRMGENMVFVQLQLSTVQGPGEPQRQDGTSTSSSSTATPQRPSATPITPRTATLLSQRGLSASALAQATRCIRRRIHHLQGSGQSSPAPTSSMAVNTSTVPISSTSSSSSSPSSSGDAAHSVMMTASAPVTPPLPTKAGRKPTNGPSLLQLPTSSSSSHAPQLQNLPSSSSASSSSLPSPPPSPGAVINSLNHVGSGVYSGTFSGTLDRSLQEANGQPRRSVHTILHILNDLLVASPSSHVATTARPKTRLTAHTPTRPSSSPLPSSSSSSSSTSSRPKNLPAQQVFFNQNLTTLTPPPSPKMADNTGSFLLDQADNELLRGKMQRVQLMLAQRKESRGKRRHTVAPYPQSTATTSTSSSNDAFTHCSSCPANLVASNMDTFVGPVQKPAAVAASDIAMAAAEGDAAASTSSCPCTSTSTSTSTSSSSAAVVAPTPPSSSSSSLSSSSTSDRPRISPHVEEGGECCRMDHDSLVV